MTEDLDLWDGLAARIDDAETLFELGREERRRLGRAPSWTSRDRVGGRGASTSSSCARCSPASTTRPMRSARSSPARAGPTRRTGPTCCCAWTCAGPSGAASTSSSTRCRPGSEAGISSATFLVQGPPRLRAAALRARRAPPGAHLAVQRPGQAPDRVRGAQGHAVPRRGARHRDRREGPAHRHLPLVGRRRPARQRDRLGRAHHPPADRHRGVVPERAQPAPEQGPGHADPQGQAGRAPATRSARPSSTASGASSGRSISAARSAPTCSSPTRWSRTCGPTTRPATSTGCSTAISTRSWRPICAGCGSQGEAATEPIEAADSGRPGGVPTGAGPLVT